MSSVMEPSRRPNGREQVGQETPKLEGTWGLSGLPVLINVVPYNSKKTERPEPSGGPGKYKASFLLGKPDRPPIEENHVLFEFDAASGGSHLFLGDPNEVFLEISANLPNGKYDFKGHANAEGYLSRIDIEEFDAINLQDAVDKAFNGLYPILSRISILNDTPVFVHRWAVKEIATNAHLSSFTLPFLNKAAPVFDNVPKEPEFEGFASLYREGLNSNSQNYQFLCFYKIIEGIRRIREERTRIENQELLAAGKTPSRPRELLPKTPEEQVAWLNALFGRQRWSDLALKQAFPEVALGRKVNDVIRSSAELDTIRNKIAHTVFRDESLEPISIDNAQQIREVSEWLPLCKAIALYLLRKEYSGAFGIGI